MGSTNEIHEIDVVEVTKHQPYGLLEGAQGTVVGLYGDTCTIEVVHPEGYVIGLFDVPLTDVELIWSNATQAPVARDD